MAKSKEQKSKKLHPSIADIVADLANLSTHLRERDELATQLDALQDKVGSLEEQLEAANARVAEFEDLLNEAEQGPCSECDWIADEADHMRTHIEYLERLLRKNKIVFESLNDHEERTQEEARQ